MRAKGEGSIYERPDGKYVAQVDAGINPETGRRRYLRRVRSSKRDASRALKELLREAGSPAARDGVTVADWCQEWVADCADRVRAGTLAARTAVGYESDVRNHIIPAIGHVRLDLLSPGHVQRMMTAMQASGLKPRTAAAARSALSAALSAAIADGLLTVNVARAVRPPPQARTDPSAFTDVELGKIADGCRVHRLGNAFMFAALTGLRTSELIGLRWADVDLDDGTYQVVEGLHRIGKTGADVLGIDPGLHASKPKNAGSGRRTPLSPAAVDVLRRQRKAQAAERLAAPTWSDTGRVFTTPIGTPLDADNVRKQWQQLLADVKVVVTSRQGRGRGLHELRRTFATRLRDQGVPLEDVQLLGRWSSSTTLLKHYAAVDDDRLRRAAGQADGGVTW